MTSYRNVGWLVISLSLLVAAACSGSSTSSTSGAATSTSTTPGLTSLDGTPEGRGDHPGFQVQAPSPPWTLFKGFAVTNDSGGGFRAVSVWDVGKVARNPCHSIGNLVDPGPTVDDLVAALEAQSMRHADRADGRDARRLSGEVP